jgi:hypothetical protein
VTFTSSVILLYLLSSIPGTVSAGLIFPFSYMRRNIPTIFSSYTLSLYPPPPTGTIPKDRTCFAFLFSNFEKQTFCLLKIAIQGVSL